MAYEGWLNYDGVEIANRFRTALLARNYGIDAMWSTPEQERWLALALGLYGFGEAPFGETVFGDGEGTGYETVEQAPWYDPNHIPSGEFFGMVPLTVEGLDSSTAQSTAVEYITDGGALGLTRNGTLDIVISAALVASTERGAEYGKNWLSRTLRGGSSGLCGGGSLRYFRYADIEAPMVHRLDVKVSRGISVTRKRNDDDSSVWLITFTLTAGNPFEYGEAIPFLSGLGGSSPSAIATPLLSSGTTTLIHDSCPTYDYTPIYDPNYPALVPSPTVPDFYPAGWNLSDGSILNRWWAIAGAINPTLLNVVPVITLRADVDTRMVRVSLWDSTSAVTDQCEPLFTAVVTYLPAATDFVIDGEQKASYVDTGFAAVRRTDSLVYGQEAQPVEWSEFNDPLSLMVTLDVLNGEGAGTVRASVSLVQKSD